MQEHKLQVFKNKGLRKISVFMRNEGQCMMNSPSMIRIVKSKLGLTSHVIRRANEVQETS